MNTPSRNRSGFTLIELLTVIAIIGILAAVLFPGVQGVMRAAKKSSAQTKLTNIAKAYVNFNNSGSGGKFIKPGTWSVTDNTKAASMSDYAAVLAFNVDLNEAEIWYVEADIKNESASFPKQVLTGSGDNRTVAAALKTGSAEDGYISWSAYAPTSRNVSSSIPLVWTRGLGVDGKWSATEGVWASEGGHISFGDGHVVWVSNTSDAENQFVNRVTAGTTTVSWKNAVSTTAFAGDVLPQ